jgi:succinate dehydrogenase / fumarate reductase, membrane anchor subunit
MDFRTPIAKVKRQGSARHGTKHMAHQRLTAIFLVPLMIWFVLSVVLITQNPIPHLSYFVSSSVNISLCLMFLATSIYHGMLGMQVVIEDYVHCKMMKAVLLYTLYFVSIFSILCAVVTIFMFFL